MFDWYILILEKPSPCTDIFHFLKGHSGGLSEAWQIMCQVFKAVCQSCNCGVTVTTKQSLFSTLTSWKLSWSMLDVEASWKIPPMKNMKVRAWEVKDVSVHWLHYRCLFRSGNWMFSPPEWVCDGEYLGHPATIWSLCVVLFHLVCGYLPFHIEVNIIYHKMCFAPGVSEGF